MGIRLDAKLGTSPLLKGRLECGESILRRVGCLPTFRMQEVATGSVALAKVLYGVVLADGRYRLAVHRAHSGLQSRHYSRR